MSEEKAKDGEVAGSEMSFGDHLDELRSRLIKAILSTILTFFIVFWWRDEVMAFVTRPYYDVAMDLRMNPALFNRKPAGAFVNHLTVSGIVALLISAPIWMWQFWAFVAAGLYRHEKAVVYKFAPPMFLLFGAGVWFGYSVLIPIGMSYLLSFSDPNIVQNWIELSEYLTLFTTMTLMLGLAFQLPILMGAVAKLGLIGSAGFRRYRRHFILGAFVLAAVLTPPDAVSQCLMAAPLLFLFETGAVIAWFGEGKRLRDVEWRRYRLHAAIGVIVVVALYVSSDLLMTAWDERLAAQRVVLAERHSGESGFDYLRLFSRVGWIGFEPKRAYRITEKKDEATGKATSELWALGDDSRALLAEVDFKNDTIAEVSQEAGNARFLVNPGTQTVTVHRVHEKPGSEFMELIVTAIGKSGAIEKAAIEALAAGLLGRRPDGAVALDEDSSDEDVLATERAWAKWWSESGASWIWKSEGGH